MYIARHVANFPCNVEDDLQLSCKVSLVLGGTIQVAGSAHQKMVSLDFPKSSIYWLISACFLAMTIYAVIVFWHHFRSGSSRLIDPETAKAAGPSL